MKKKSRTPEQKIKRGKFALGAIAVMTMICVIAGLTTRCEDDVNTDIVTETMDDALDSLLIDAGFRNATIVEKNRQIRGSHIVHCLESDTLFNYQAYLKLGYNVSEKERQNLTSEIERLKMAVENHFNDPSNKMEYYSRRIRFESEEGVLYTAVQNMDTTLVNHQLKHLLEVDLQEEKFIEEKIEEIYHESSGIL